MITFRLKESPTVPLEAESLVPDRMVGQSNDAICGLPVFLGKRQCRLDEFFDVDGADSDQMEVHGDVSKVKWIGREMSRGHIKIEGNAGMHLGAYMKGGTIEVTGNGSDWTGAEMTDGLIRIRGNAGGQIGAAYRGSLAGMKGGTIFLCSGAEIRTGAWMFRGTIVSLTPIQLLPTFAYSCAYNPTFLRIYAKFLQKLGVTIPVDSTEGSYLRYTGDSSVPGKGEIFVWQPRNQA